MRLAEWLEGLLVGLLGRPVLWLCKRLRWAFLVGGALFTMVSSYNPATGQETTRRTAVPVLAGVLLFSVGAVRRYDELVATFYTLHPIARPAAPSRPLPGQDR